jgi:hypothetical protein
MKIRNGFVSNSSSSSFLIKISSERRTPCYNCKSYPFDADSLADLIERSWDADTELTFFCKDTNKEIERLWEDYKEETNECDKRRIKHLVERLGSLENDGSYYIEAEISNSSRGLLALIWLLTETKDIEILETEEY